MWGDVYLGALSIFPLTSEIGRQYDVINSDKININCTGTFDMALYTSSHLNMHSVIAAPDKQLVAPGWMGAVAPDLPGEVHAIYPLRPTKSSPMILSPMSTRTSVMLIWQVLTTNLVVLFLLSTLGFLPPAGNTMLKELTIQTMQSPCTPGPMLQFNILQISCTDSYVVCSISDRFHSKHDTTSFSPGN